MQVSSAAKGAYYHPLFVKDNRGLCRHIVRPKAVSSRKTSSSCSNTLQISPEEFLQDTANVTTTMQAPCPQPVNPSPILNSGGVPFMLGQKFEHLPRGGLDFNVRSNAPLRSMEARASPAFSSREFGVVSPSVESDIPGRNNTMPDMDFQETATQSLYRSMQLAMNEQPDVARVADSQQYPHQQDTLRDAQDPASGAIYSMSIGNSTTVNFQALREDKDIMPSTHGFQRIMYGTASIQELEPYRDSIITLFGGSADLPYVA